MSILNTLPDGTQQARPSFPPAAPPIGVHGATDFHHDGNIRAVVTVQIAVTRDMLAVTLADFAGRNWDQDPDDWSVGYIREAVAMNLVHDSVVEIEQDAHDFPDWDGMDDETRRRVQAVYRAVDRAYPHQAPKGDA